MAATYLWKLSRPGVIRLPFLCPVGEHVIAAIGVDRRILAYARVFDHAEEFALGQLIDRWLDEPSCPAPFPFQRPPVDDHSRRRWASGGMT